MSRLLVALVYGLSLLPVRAWAVAVEGEGAPEAPAPVTLATEMPLPPSMPLELGTLPAVPSIPGPALSPDVPTAQPAVPAAVPELPAAVAASLSPDQPVDPPQASAAPDAAAPYAAVPGTAPVVPRRAPALVRLAGRWARALWPGRRPDEEASASDAPLAAPEASSADRLAPARPAAERRGRPSGVENPPPPGAKAKFMSATFVYNLATSIMLVVQQPLLFTLAKQAQLAKGAADGPAGLHAAGVVFALATLTGALRIPGNSLGAWLSARTDQKTLGVVSGVARAAILGAVAALFFAGHMTLPLAAALYSADWLIGGLEEVSRNTQTLALVRPQSAHFKSWSTLSQFWAQLTGLFGPAFVVALAQFKGLDVAGYVAAPALFALSSVLYFLLPRDVYQRAAPAPAAARVSRWASWRLVLQDRRLLYPVAGLALLSTLLLKGPLSLNMASLLMGKSGAGLVTYSALLSGIFGAGLGAGTWLAHAGGEKGSRRRSAAQWLGLGAAATVALAGSWLFGFWPAGVFPAVAAAWFAFALTNAAAQALLMHQLQRSVASAGPEKKAVIGVALTLSNAFITALRVLAGAIFFLWAGSWMMGFGLIGAALLTVAAGQWWISRRMGGSDER